MNDNEGFTYRSTSNLTTIWALIASVGWYLLAIAIALFCASPYLGEKYQSWKQKKDEEEYKIKYHKNPDLFEERSRAIEAARQKLQEKYNEEARKAQEKEEERKRLKKQQLLNLKKDGGQRLGTADDASTSKSSKLYDEYNPLMGDSSRGYKPPKRSCCGKGCK
ncbi:uncharacterized protein [Chelonus insularis]|uniref:uncharacterized protein n=1 Tax=Chelonus insularis TaxID=460826 RepID=UPI00158A93BD|nr:uncharacterized protein LOC118071140 [Chelonus insularis]